MNIYEEYIACQQDFSYFCQTYVKMSYPNGIIRPFELYQYQKDYIKFFENNNCSICVKFRHGGFVTLSVIYAFWKCMFHSNICFFIACKTERESIHVAKIVDNILSYFPENFKPSFYKNTKTRKVFQLTGSKLFFGSIDQINSLKLTHLFIDEAAFIKNLDNKWESIIPAIYSAKIMISSTTNGLGNWFYDIYKGAKNKENSFEIFPSNYLDNPLYQNKVWVEELYKSLGEESWQQEVLGNFVGKAISNHSCANDTDSELISKLLPICSERISEESRAALNEVINRFRP